MLSATEQAAYGSILSPYSFDIPHAFVYNDSPSAEQLFCGPYLEMAMNFAEVNRYRLLLDELESLPKKSAIEQDIVNGQYDISIHGVLIRPVKEEKFAEEMRYSYPLELMMNCVMVPLDPELPKWMYVVWPLGKYIWTSLFLGIFYVAFLLRYLHWRETAQATRSYTRNMLQAMAILMFSPNMNMNLRLSQATLRVNLFYTLLFTLGFILSNYHSSHMTAYDMKPVFTRPIDSWADLIISRLPIILPESLLEELRSLPIDYQALLASPSRSYAYVVTQDTWKFFNRQQRVLIQPHFRLSSVCFGGLYNAIPMRRNATFALQLDRFILYAWQAGLWNYWEDVAFRYAVRGGYAQIFLDTYPVEPLDLQFFTTAWLVLVVGFPVSFLAWCIEICMHRRYARRVHYDRFECYDDNSAHQLSV
ncbi:uncharacterized protein LOC117890500 [Drosophila subobscura]|uniref:uncharacterized protein LOC117890500 n=1 Tax=Drosophila subobscura TaxID=7241 RepID=UPI00155A80DE|nr:uncharacterized protein LOC117890500 [Drosophila subobscura]